MHFDGSKLLNGSGAGVLLQSPTGNKLHYVMQIHFEAMNNMAEYEALIHGLRIAKDIGIKPIVCCGDSDAAGGWHLECVETYDDGISRRSGRDSAKSFLGYEVKYVPR